MFSHLIDEDLELRLLEQHHAAELFELTDQNREYLREWLPWVDGTRAVTDTRRFIIASLYEFAEGRAMAAGVWRRGSLVGSAGFTSIDRSGGRAEIGYWLGLHAQGEGIMTRVCRTLVRICFDELDLHRVEIHCATENRRSRAIAERLGFKQEGVLRQVEWLYDRWVDHAVYAMLRSEWTVPCEGAGLGSPG
jgi:ribosomal-protein-serine acetyltransferase